MKYLVRRRIVFTIIFSLIFIILAIIIKSISWKIYLTVPRKALHSWMDPREQTLIIKYLQKFNETSSGQLSTMLEYGAGSSTFVYSSYVHQYISIEHNIDYCGILESMAANEPHRWIVISYMKSHLSGFVETHRYEKNTPKVKTTPSIQIYCIIPTYSMLRRRFFSVHGHSTYSMYQNYIDFISIFLQNQLFDFVLIDGRARPQAAYTVLKHLNGLHAKVFVHDWNFRKAYHVITQEFYNIIDQQVESNQLGGGGLVVLERKYDVTGEAKLNEIQWKNVREPSWWL